MPLHDTLNSALHPNRLRFHFNESRYLHTSWAPENQGPAKTFLNVFLWRMPFSSYIACESGRKESIDA